MFRTPGEKHYRALTSEGRHLFMASRKHPEHLKYSKTDEWVHVKGDQATIGITDYAQDQLGDIGYIELPWGPATTVSHETNFGDLESVKATSQLLSPMRGEVV